MKIELSQEELQLILSWATVYDITKGFGMKVSEQELVQRLLGAIEGLPSNKP
jgi:hypothetical protein